MRKTPKIPECESCQFYSPTPYVVCGVHPEGLEGDNCMDFRADPKKERGEKWSPEGYSWYGDELIRNQSYLTREEQLEMLDTHPFFTGICPKCGHRFNQKKPPLVHWDCIDPDCNWIN